MNKEGAYRSLYFRSGVGFYSSQDCRGFRTLRPFSPIQSSAQPREQDLKGRHCCIDIKRVSFQQPSGTLQGRLRVIGVD